MRDERLKQLGLNIKMERIKKGLSQEELAEIVNTSRNTISMIETAKQHATILKIVDIAKALEIDINTLIANI
ncbi:helix-turn-helix transcriptional regulator [bacterium]|nr:helix-turn-helix transcriptional regulator [bacterium]